MSQGPTRREQGLPSAYQRTPDVTAGTRALAQGMGAASDAAMQIAERDAQTLANQADVEITTGWLKWDAENRSKFTGANADQYAPAAEKWWKDTSASYAGKLDPMARGLVGPALARRQGAALSDVVRFTGIEKEKHADSVAAASVDTAIQFGVTSGDVAGAAERVRELAAMTGARKGWTTEQVQAQQGKYLSALHVAQIAKLSEVDATAAQTYYDRNKLEVGFTEQANIEKMLKGELDNQFATQFAAQHAALSYEEQLAKAGEITNPARREKALLALRNQHAQIREAQEARESHYADTAWQLVAQGKRVPEAILGAMDGRARVQLQDHVRSEAERRAAGGGKSVKTDPVFMARLLDSINDDPDGFRQMRIESLVGKMSQSDIEQIAGLQRKLREPDKEKDVATTTQLMSTYTSGWKPEKRAVFQSSMFNELDQFEREKKRPATFAEKRQIADRLMLDGEVLTGSWWRPDANKKLFEATPEERAKFAPDISKDDRALVVQALKAEGIASPTEQQITARFKLAKGIR